MKKSTIYLISLGVAIILFMVIGVMLTQGPSEKEIRAEVEEGSPYAMLALVSKYDHAKETFVLNASERKQYFATAVAELQKRADNDDPEALYSLTEIRDLVYNKPILDTATKFKYLRLAATKKYAPAIDELIEKRPKEKLQWMIFGYENVSKEYAYQLAKYYEMLSDVPDADAEKNKELAKSYYKAYSEGNPESGIRKKRAERSVEILNDEREATDGNMPWWFWVILGLVVLALAGYTFSQVFDFKEKDECLSDNALKQKLYFIPWLCALTGPFGLLLIPFGCLKVRECDDSPEVMKKRITRLVWISIAASLFFYILMIVVAAVIALMLSGNMAKKEMLGGGSSSSSSGGGYNMNNYHNCPYSDGKWCTRFNESCRALRGSCNTN